MWAVITILSKLGIILIKQVIYVFARYPLAVFLEPNLEIWDFEVMVVQHEVVA